MIGKNFTSASKDDNVYTPYSMSEQLLEHEDFDYNKSVLEPARGNNAVIEILSQKFNIDNIADFDINYKYNKMFQKDFINEQITRYNYIITNPPYKILDEFIVKAKEIVTDKFAFLCKLTHLGGVGRFNSGIFRDEKYPLTKIYLFTRQANLRFTTEFEEKKGYISYRKLREDGKYPAGMYYYCWLIWENMNKKYREVELFGDYPVLRWIDNNKYILKRGE